MNNIIQDESTTMSLNSTLHALNQGDQNEAVYSLINQESMIETECHSTCNVQSNNEIENLNKGLLLKLYKYSRSYLYINLFENKF